METNVFDNIFKGLWNVVALENRVEGQWRRNQDFEPGEWSIGFLGAGRWIETFRSETIRQSGRWVFDNRTGRLLTALSSAPEYLRYHAFEGDQDSGWLYTNEADPRLPLTPDDIIVRHATQRLRLVRAGGVNPIE
jgi:hypothetical protein